jgi:hypothetical protein
MTFEEQFDSNNNNNHPIPISLTLRFTLGGLWPESQDEIPLRGEGCDTPVSPRFFSENAKSIRANSLYATGKYTRSLYATGPTCHRHKKIYLYATQWHTRNEYKIGWHTRNFSKNDTGRYFTIPFWTLLAGVDSMRACGPARTRI